LNETDKMLNPEEWKDNKFKERHV